MLGVSHVAEQHEHDAGEKLAFHIVFVVLHVHA